MGAVRAESGAFESDFGSMERPLAAFDVDRPWVGKRISSMLTVYRDIDEPSASGVPVVVPRTSSDRATKRSKEVLTDDPVETGDETFQGALTDDRLEDSK